MAAIRGVNSLFPCPICLVPEAELLDLGEKYPLRTTQTMKKVVEEASEMRTAAEAEAHLKAHGLRPITVMPCSLFQTR